MPKLLTENAALIAELKESQSRLSTIIDAAVDGIITFDRKGIIHSMNPSASALFGYGEEKVVGKNLCTLMKADHVGQDEATLTLIFNIEAKTRGEQTIGIKKNGEAFPIRLKVEEMGLESGTIFTGIIHDMTEEERAKDELMALNVTLEQQVKLRTQELEVLMSELRTEVKDQEKKDLKVRGLLKKEIDLSKLKSRFVSMASHEFRTPLTGIYSAATLVGKLDGPENKEKRKRYVSVIHNSVDDLSAILNDFLSMDKLQSGKLTLQDSKFDLLELINEVSEGFEHALTGGRHFKRKLTLVQPDIYTDRNILKNILLNLVSNAVKYSRVNGEIGLICNLKSGRLEFEISDEGIGIPDQDKEHMFERFFRAHNVTNIKGTGLGLNIVKRYLDLMNGRISFSSQEGFGTTFKVFIPLNTQNKEHDGK